MLIFFPTSLYRKPYLYLTEAESSLFYLAAVLSPLNMRMGITTTSAIRRGTRKLIEYAKY